MGSKDFRTRAAKTRFCQWHKDDYSHGNRECSDKVVTGSIYCATHRALALSVALKKTQGATE